MKRSQFHGNIDLILLQDHIFSECFDWENLHPTTPKRSTPNVELHLLLFCMWILKCITPSWVYIGCLPDVGTENVWKTIDKINKMQINTFICEDDWIWWENATWLGCGSLIEDFRELRKGTGQERSVTTGKTDGRREARKTADEWRKTNNVQDTESGKMKTVTAGFLIKID